MGILNSLSKNPSLIVLAALGIGLFIFKDKISGFFSDITGGAEGAASIAETGGLLARNLKSNLTLTPLPEDAIFGESGLFAGIGKFFTDFKFPSFDFFPSADALPTVLTEDIPSGDFTGTGMAGARARQPTDAELGIGVEGFDVKGFARLGDITNPQGLLGDIAKAIVPETQSQFQERAAGLVETFPDVFRSTSLSDEISFGRQLSRESEDFESVLAAEARRSEEIFAKLFGNVQNPNF